MEGAVFFKSLMIREKINAVKQAFHVDLTDAQKMGGSILQRALPGSDCVLCLDPAGTRWLCDNCERLLASGCRRCPRCASRVPAGENCGECLSAPPAFDGVTAAFDYSFPIDRLVGRFKFSADLALGAYLADALAATAGGAPVPDLIVATPASRERLVERGFHSSLFLARRVGSRLGLAVDAHLLRKVRHTPTQTGQDRRARRRNVAGAFAVQRRLEGLHVAVVDDVVTTGATLGAIAEALKEVGAARVTGWVVARTPMSPRAG